MKRITQLAKVAFAVVGVRGGGNSPTASKRRNSAPARLEGIENMGGDSDPQPACCIPRACSQELEYWITPPACYFRGAASAGSQHQCLQQDGTGMQEFYGTAMQEFYGTGMQEFCGQHQCPQQYSTGMQEFYGQPETSTQQTQQWMHQQDQMGPPATMAPTTTTQSEQLDEQELAIRKKLAGFQQVKEDQLRLAELQRQERAHADGQIQMGDSPGQSGQVEHGKEPGEERGGEVLSGCSSSSSSSSSLEHDHRQQQYIQQEQQYPAPAASPPALSPPALSPASPSAASDGIPAGQSHPQQPVGESRKADLTHDGKLPPGPPKRKKRNPRDPSSPLERLKHTRHVLNAACNNLEGLRDNKTEVDDLAQKIKAKEAEIRDRLEEINEIIRRGFPSGKSLVAGPTTSREMKRAETLLEKAAPSCCGDAHVDANV